MLARAMVVSDLEETLEEKKAAGKDITAVEGLDESELTVELARLIGRDDSEPTVEFTVPVERDESEMAVEVETFCLSEKGRGLLTTNTRRLASSCLLILPSELFKVHRFFLPR